MERHKYVWCGHAYWKIKDGDRYIPDMTCSLYKYMSRDTRDSPHRIEGGRILVRTSSASPDAVLLNVRRQIARQCKRADGGWKIEHTHVHLETDMCMVVNGKPADSICTRTCRGCGAVLSEDGFCPVCDFGLVDQDFLDSNRDSMIVV